MTAPVKKKFVFDMVTRPVFSEVIEVVSDSEKDAEQIARNILAMNNEGEDVLPVWRSEEPDEVEVLSKLIESSDATPEEIAMFEKEQRVRLEDEEFDDEFDRDGEEDDEDEEDEGFQDLGEEEKDGESDQTW